MKLIFGLNSAGFFGWGSAPAADEPIAHTIDVGWAGEPILYEVRAPGGDVASYVATERTTGNWMFRLLEATSLAVTPKGWNTTVIKAPTAPRVIIEVPAGTTVHCLYPGPQPESVITNGQPHPHMTLAELADAFPGSMILSPPARGAGVEALPHFMDALHEWMQKHKVPAHVMVAAFVRCVMCGAPLGLPDDIGDVLKEKLAGGPCPRCDAQREGGGE